MRHLSRNEVKLDLEFYRKEPISDREIVGSYAFFPRNIIGSRHRLWKKSIDTLIVSPRALLSRNLFIRFEFYGSLCDTRRAITRNVRTKFASALCRALECCIIILYHNIMSQIIDGKSQSNVRSYQNFLCHRGAAVARRPWRILAKKAPPKKYLRFIRAFRPSLDNPIRSAPL